MPAVGLPSTGASRQPRGPGSTNKGFAGRGAKKVTPSLGAVAQDIDGKERTEDVVTEDSRERTFADMMLSEPVLKGLKNAGFSQPSPVQILAIPPAKLGFDLVVQSKSGTGKTAVYVVTALEMMKVSASGLQCLVVAPTREIAVQGATVAMQLGSNLSGLKVATFIGGISLAEDKVKARTCHLAVGTPGRIKQLITEGFLTTDSVRLVIMDEADKLLEPAFLSDTTDILNLMPRSKQVLALSATYPDQLASIAERFMRSPQHIRPGQKSQVLTGVAQFVHTIAHSPTAARQTSLKQAGLLNILSSVPYSQVLVFSNYSTIAQSTCDYLNSRGFPAVFISSNQEQARRNAVIQTFKQFGCRVLCSTDLTARGIDAENVNLVVNLEVPWEHNTYLHRIGRGGRFGSLSLAVTLASEGEEMGKLRNIVKKTGSIIKILPEEIPQDVRGNMAEMEVLDPAEESKEIEDEDGLIKVTKAQKTCGKTKGSDKENLSKKKSSDTGNPKPTQEKVTDSAIVKRHVTQIIEDAKIPKSTYNIDGINDMLSMLKSGEDIGHPGIVEVPEESKESMERLGKALSNCGSSLRKDIRWQMENNLKKIKGKSKSEVIQSLLEVEEPAVMFTTSESSDTSPEKIENYVSEHTSSSSSSSDDSSSEEEESEEDEEEEEEDEEASQLNSAHPFPSYYHPGNPYRQYHQYQVNLAWYQQWSTSLAQQRQRLECQQYWAELAKSQTRRT